MRGLADLLGVAGVEIAVVSLIVEQVLFEKGGGEGFGVLVKEVLGTGFDEFGAVGELATDDAVGTIGGHGLKRRKMFLDGGGEGVAVGSVPKGSLLNLCESFRPVETIPHGHEQVERLDTVVF